MRTLLIAAAVAALGLSSSGCLVGTDAPEAYDGNWNGSWDLDDGTASGPLSMTLHHVGRHVSGSVSIGGTFCIGDADLDAEAHPGGLSGSFTNHIGGVVDIDGEVDEKDVFSGSFTVTSGFCSGSSGTFDMTH